MFDEYAVVKAKRDLSTKVPKGTRGVIVMIYDKDIGDYEVEFVDKESNYLELLTVNEKDLTDKEPDDQ